RPIRWLRTLGKSKTKPTSAPTLPIAAPLPATAPGATPLHATRATVAGDNPVQTPDADTLGRGAIARAFAQHVLTLDVTEGVVVGVLGAWGSGKTSFVNLARPEFERTGVTVVDFNPWMFSGAEQLVESFFIELAAQLRMRAGLEEIGK